MHGNIGPLRLATEGDLPAIASIHRKAYSSAHFTSRLPAAVLTRYYRLFLTDGAETLVLSAPLGKGAAEIVGFAVFGRNIESKIAQFKKENAAAIMSVAVRHPVAAGIKVLRRLWTKAARGEAMATAGYLLLSIAVAKPGAGIGGVLLDALIERARADGADRIGLYVNIDNIPAINSYVRRGFVVRELRDRQFYMEKSLSRDSIEIYSA